MKHSFRRALVCVAVAIALTALASPARAQDSYYEEIAREGRIYVFTTETAEKTWDASKELAVGTVTRPGYGPGGETVVFEGPAAVEAFNKKYGKTDAPPKDAPTVEYKLPFDVKYRMPGLRFTFPKFELNMVNRMQLRYTYDDQDSSAPQSDKGSFRVRRMKTKLDGWIYTRDLTYELQLNYVQTPSPIEDANIDYDFTGGKKAFRLKFGQFKAPFGQQELTSSGSQQFVDRSIANAFAPARQLGLQIWGQFGPASVPDLIDWRGGIFNGNGVNQATNDNDKYMYVGRVVVSPFGSPGYSESNLEGYDFRIGLGAEYLVNNTIVIPPSGDPTGTDVNPQSGASVVIKAAKIVFAYGEYYWQGVTSVAGAKTRRSGGTFQAGVLVLPELEVAARYAFVDPNRDAEDNLQKEWRGGVSYYINKHNWKIQADYAELRNEAATGRDGEKPKKDKEFRLQAQLIF